MSGDSPLLRVLVAEDDPSVRDALCDLIDAEPGFELVGAAADATEAIALAAATKPDVALVDVRMPGGGGVTAVRGIRRRSRRTQVLALTGHSDHATVMQMLEAGVAGYLVKGGPVEEIIQAIKQAPSGVSALSAEVASGVIHELAGELSTRRRNRRTKTLIERRMHRAMGDRDALAMVFQPIVHLQDRVVVGAEALARFSGPPERAPSLWFAESAIVGLREELELTAIRKALEELPKLPREAYLTLNVSPITLIHPQLVELMSGDVDSSRLVVEITEHAPIDDYPRLAGVLAELRLRGVRLAIDDAGAGYSSLRHILELNPELIKLDITLIRNINRDTSKQALAAGIISFADKIGTSIIAEGIERVAELRTLLELGVAVGQGFLLGRPSPLPLGSPRHAPGGPPAAATL